MSVNTEIPALLRELVGNQELQFNRLFKEQENSNTYLRDELADMKTRFQNMEMQLIRNKNVQKDNVTIKSTLVENSEAIQVSGGSGIETELIELKEKHLALEIDYRMQKCRIDDPNISIVGTKSRQFRSDSANAELERKVEELERELELSRKEKAELMTKPNANNDTEEKLQKAEIQYSNLENTHNNLMDQYNEIFRNNTAQEKRIRDLEKELDEFKGRDRERNMREMNILDTSIGNDQAFKILQQENQILRVDLEEERATKIAIEKNNQGKDDLLHSLLEDKTYFSNKVELQEKSISKLRSDLEVAEAAQRRCHQLEIENSDLELNYQTRLSEYNIAIEQRNEIHKHYEQQKAEFSELRMSSQTYDRAIKERDAKLKSLYEENIQLKDSVESHSVTHQFLQEEQLRIQKESEDLQRTIQNLKTELEKKKQEVSDVRRDLEARKNLHPTYTNPYMGPYNPSGMSRAPSGFDSQSFTGNSSQSSGSPPRFSYNSPDS
ncbi:hypothetical protein LOD99_13535 [Oopsacas minuta]|uniref:Uncharacterized protein n=1 Tax=Oopsacas minuta TaxID=111878 RepID=A0AAV7KKR7_9METZ|nr:hypothetical protein LOD99_13535 [Oopsacas minuta]